MKKVKDTKIDDEFIVVKDMNNIIEISKSLAENGIPDAVVINEDNKVLGALDVYDIVSKCLAEERDPYKTTAKEIMYVGPKVKLETDLENVLKIMQELQVTTLPVVDDENNLMGVITNLDVFDGLNSDK